MTDEHDATPPAILSTAEDLFRNARPGEVDLGGIFRQPRLSIGYARAARLLLSASAEEEEPHTLLPPVFYLVRHAVELALKDLFHAHRQNEIDQQLIDKHDGVSRDAKLLALPRLDAISGNITKTHNLSEILGYVREVLTVHVQPNWGHLVQHIERHEGSAPDWSRYETVRYEKNNRKAPMVPSYKQPQVVAIQELVGELELFIQQAAVITSEPQKDGEISVLEELGLRSQDLGRQLYSRGLRQQLDSRGLL